jgi:hypothetical protein
MIQLLSFSWQVKDRKTENIDRIPQPQEVSPRYHLVGNLIVRIGVSIRVRVRIRVRFRRWLTLRVSWELRPVLRMGLGFVFGGIL